MKALKFVLERIKALRGPARVFVIVGVFAVVAAAFLLRGQDDAADKNQFYTVKRGNFSVTITEGGSLRAVNEVVIRSEVEGMPRIIKIVPEGTVVKEGDLLVELDSAELRDRKTQQELQVEQAQFSYDASLQDLFIQKSIHESNMKDADLKLTFAESDLDKYVNGDVKQSLKTATNSIFLAEEELKQAEDRLEWTKKLKEQTFATEAEFEKDDLAAKRARIALEKANADADLLVRYDIPKKRLQLEANTDSAKMEKMRIQHRGEAAIAQYEQTVVSRKRALDLQKDKMSEIAQQLELTKIRAPQDGMVVYPFYDRYGSSQSQVEEGAQVRQRQELIKLPDTSQMLVEVKVHESYVNQMRPGLPANVTVDSMPDVSFDGIIRKVAVLPDTSSRYSNPNLKVYATEVLITDKLPDIKPGVSARAEIIITNLLGVITVPIQAVSTVKGKPVCYVAAGMGDPVPVAIEVGLYNDKFIEVRSGLREGDRVLLSPPLNTEEADPEAAMEKNLNRKAKELKPGEIPGDKPRPMGPGVYPPGSQPPRERSSERSSERPSGSGDSGGERKFKRPSGDGGTGGGSGGSGRPPGGSGGGDRPSRSSSPTGPG